MTFITNVITTPTPDQRGAFARLRVCDPHTLFSASHIKNINTTQETQSITGTGTITLDANNPTVLLALTGAGTLIKQSRERGIYQPSKSLLVLMTGVINGNNNASGVTSRIGYFDTDDGIYFEHRGNEGLFISKRSSNTGSIVNTSIAQSNWNFDKMDGTGPSGITFDTSKTHIFFMDFEWLGVGTVRTGVVVDGAFRFTHIFHHANNETVPYINNPNLPVRYEITSTGGIGTLKKICYAVISEGGVPKIGRQLSLNMGVTLKSTSSTNSCIIAIRIKTTNPKTQIQINNISGMTGAKKDAIAELSIVRDTAHATVLTGASWISAGTNTSIEYDISSTTYDSTNAIVLNSSYLTVSNPAISTNIVGATNNTLTTNVDGLSDLFIVSVRVIGVGSDTASFIINYTEIN